VEVFAAASLTDALKEIAADYEKEQAATRSSLISPPRIRSICKSRRARPPIFFLRRRGEDGRSGQAKPDREGKPQGPSFQQPGHRRAQRQHADADLGRATGRPKIAKIALGQPQSVPAGIYAKEYLQKIGIWEKVSARVIPCESVRAALAAVETGNVDAGIVYKTDALHSTKVKVAWEVPVAEGPDITYPSRAAGVIQARGGGEKVSRLSGGTRFAEGV
jgi:molybdate transport system substrate-binding protein